ncbi:hypothetical protein NXC24_CH01619 [Rhizobium sp. NXC24]|nr:hypothetical protein NXC24_CH01619 [Rhizobium sp. NXC24]
MSTRSHLRGKTHGRHTAYSTPLGSHRSLAGPRPLHSRPRPARRLIVQDRQGLVGGLFTNEAAAVHFAAEECNHNPADICLAPEGSVLDLDGFATPFPNLH